jgi:hypothetical protein
MKFLQRDPVVVLPGDKGGRVMSRAPPKDGKVIVEG